ncbi:hypothetical protein Goshw_027296 [Gossypium schwendimanii]|uniref:Uncharacterized protein n=1 Tax=Gossypium schwendimanii TaxID=34291 RepID=A0A7J9LRT6_GOSSC|nr:hypothetical protein [Gossypium schwendimanii]
MLRWFPVWSTCTMLKPITQIRDYKVGYLNELERMLEKVYLMLF